MTSTVPAASPDETPKADEVDRIIYAWQATRPDLDVTPMHVFSRLTRLARQFDLERRRVFAKHELEAWEFDVLSSLRREGSGNAAAALTPGQLMDELLVSSGTMTNRIDRLEQKGLVQRAPSPTDRRATLVVITAAGIAATDAAMTDLLTRERELLREFSTTETRELGINLRLLASQFDD